MLSASSSSEKIQTHLYQSFLKGSTSDVSLKCVAQTWSCVYALHRVILIQGGFFNSLFSGSWREGSRDRDYLNIIQITFEDPNITRAASLNPFPANLAFEVCLSRLYGGGPELSLSPHLQPSISHPLTQSYPNPPPEHVPPEGHHPATPRFLLSLLATATYLSMPNVASQALNLIMQSIGPFTIMRYLNFAIGKGIGEELPNDRPTAVGLDNVGKPVLAREMHHRASSAARQSFKHSPSSSTVSYKQRSFGKDSISESVLKAQGIIPDEDDAMTIPDNISYITIGTQDDNEGIMTSTAPHYFYGTIGNLIGEACATWLCRWGIDMFHWEQVIHAAEKAGENAPPSSPACLPSGQRFPLITAQTLVSLRALNSPYGTHPVIWGPQGLSVQWIRAIISSDSFFVPNEFERYAFASQVYRFRRLLTVEAGMSASLDDQCEWDLLFKTGIYYTHMTFDQLREIERDRLVRLQDLALAHWKQSLFRSVITARPNNGVASSPGANASTASRELGIAITANEIRALLEENGDSNQEVSQKPYFPVLEDTSSRTGDYLSTAGSGPADYMPNLMTAWEQGDMTPKPGSKTPRRAADESTFFGVANVVKTAKVIAKEDVAGTQKWTEYEPIRFSCEWWGVENLKEKSRMHSTTIAYAGSFYNVYLQVVRRKGVQLGLYLSRQSIVDPIPVASSPPGVHDRPHTLSMPNSLSRTLMLPTLQISTRVSHLTGAVSTSPPTPASPLTPDSTLINSPLSHASSIPNLQSSSLATAYMSAFRASSPGSSTTPRAEYRDPRPVLRAYFSIMSLSATGTSMTTFSSSPDDFGVSQSWGWKSGTCLEIPVTENTSENESVDVGEQGVLVIPAIAQWKRELHSVRATVMIGVV
ncbi:uncharacterized protein EI90DRAFT_3013293 [Cantharellus anzutake]|uniref:uncharacterized protein n=1 Tax=Cantharellus anzutake TaxID=1750568 RepID=UPI0019067349|nr:uncharacterized protein EI90DRAFT_3013293 [Cantharellus anzutake]KAF8337930.1 hypothetical protein EI90DRAFT_3013293 [Cantharellus anzutake]